MSKFLPKILEFAQLKHFTSRGSQSDTSSAEISICPMQKPYMDLQWELKGAKQAVFRARAIRSKRLLPYPISAWLGTGTLCAPTHVSRICCVRSVCLSDDRFALGKLVESRTLRRCTTVPVDRASIQFLSNVSCLYPIYVRPRAFERYTGLRNGEAFR